MSNEAAEPEPPPAPPTDPAALMDQANRRYDRLDFEGALDLAEQVLAVDPQSVRARRVATSSACALGLADRARALAAALPPHDLDQMARRCRRYGIDL